MRQNLLTDKINAVEVKANTYFVLEINYIKNGVTTILIL